MWPFDYKKRRKLREEQIKREVEIQMKLYEAEDRLIDSFFTVLENVRSK